MSTPPLWIETSRKSSSCMQMQGFLDVTRLKYGVNSSMQVSSCCRFRA